MHLEELDATAVGPYLAATPEPALSVVRRLMDGTAPSDILTSGTGGRLLESVLADLVLHGAITAIHGPKGEDLWAAGMAALPKGEASAPTPAPPPQEARSLRATPARRIQTPSPVVSPPLPAARRIQATPAPPQAEPPEPSAAPERPLSC